MSPAVDCPVDRALIQRVTALWPVDRPVDRADIESRALCRSTGSSDRGHFQRAEALWWSTGPSAWLRARSVHVGRPARSTAHCYGRPAREPLLSGSSPGRPEAFPESRALWRSTDPVDRPPQLGCVHACARQSTVPVDRLLLRSTGSADRQSASPAIIGLKNLGF